MAYVCLCANKKAIYPTLVLWFQLCSIRAKAPFVALVDDHMMNGEDFNLLEPLIDSGIKLRRFGDNGIDKMKKGIEKQDMEKRKNSSLPSFKLSYNVTKGSTRKRDTILWNKLYAWTMTEFKKLIFLDNDLLLLDNFDELFGENELSGVPISFPDEKIIFWNFNNTPIGDNIQVGWTGLNGGVMVLEPSMETYFQLVKAANNITERPCCPTQEFLYKFFEERGRYHRLDLKYNLRKIYKHPQEMQKELFKRAKIYHFIERQKPLLKGRKQADRFEKEWWNHADKADKWLEEWSQKKPHEGQDRQEIKRQIRSYAINLFT